MDMGKVVLACLLGRWLLPGNPQLGMMIAGAMTELGHIFPVFYGFRGGKGILSSAALAIMMDWRIFVIGFSLFLIIVFATHYVSLGSILAATAYAVLFVIFSPDSRGSGASPLLWPSLRSSCIAAILPVCSMARRQKPIF